MKPISNALAQSDTSFRIEPDKF